MVCGRRVGEWLDEHQLVLASCWEPAGHRWECFDRLSGLRWRPGDGVDTTGRRFLIDPADAGLCLEETVSA